jgi:hypothetical protein
LVLLAILSECLFGYVIHVFQFRELKKKREKKETKQKQKTQFLAQLS